MDTKKELGDLPHEGGPEHQHLQHRQNHAIQPTLPPIAPSHHQPMPNGQGHFHDFAHPAEGAASGEKRGIMTASGIPNQNDYGSVSNPNNPPTYESNVTVPPPIGSSGKFPLASPEKSLVDAYLLAVVFGLVGAHHFYLKRYYWGTLYFFTIGLLGCGYIVDLFRIPYLVRKYNREGHITAGTMSQRKRKDLSDAYVIWLPWGLFGFHHYYLGNYKMGALYTLTAGCFGIGWLIDCVRMPSLVREANARVDIPDRSISASYILGVPFGFLGFHHFYLNRPLFGITYVLTFGLLGVGWFVDLFRMPVLVRRYNEEVNGMRRTNVKTLDDCYVLWFPFGLIGFHHFYLGRPGWGVLYLFTFGILGIGWLVDLFRIPSLVKERNEQNKQRDDFDQAVHNFANGPHDSFSNSQNIMTHNTNGLAQSGPAVSGQYPPYPTAPGGYSPPPSFNPPPFSPPAYDYEEYHDGGAGAFPRAMPTSPPPYEK